MSCRSSGSGFRNLPVSIHLLWSCGSTVANNGTLNEGREIPEDVAARTDTENEFPAEMWKKLGDAGYD